MYTDRHGYRRIGSPADHMELLGILGFVEPPPARVRSAIIQGDWVVDIGANVGNVTADLCRLVGRRGSVWAIEPVPRNVSRLIDLCGRNDLPQLRVFPVALGDATHSADLRLPASGHSGWASFTKTWDTKGSLSVPVVRLDALVDELRPQGRLRFIKIDVEGFEPEVLRGATETLRRYRPLILCEFNDVLLRDAGTSSVQLLELFATLGYRPSRPISPITLDGQLLDIVLESDAESAHSST
ncbi:MAG: FkbM family methyltransferase [Chloroflexota bacterium]|nr:FkbM family methyltransferase [Chloroflexota bacterium]